MCTEFNNGIWRSLKVRRVDIVFIGANTNPKYIPGSNDPTVNPIDGLPNRMMP